MKKEIWTISDIFPVNVKEHSGDQLLALVSKVPDRVLFPEKVISQLDFGRDTRGAFVPSTENDKNIIFHSNCN